MSDSTLDDVQMFMEKVKEQKQNVYPENLSARQRVTIIIPFVFGMISLLLILIFFSFFWIVGFIVFGISIIIT